METSPLRCAACSGELPDGASVCPRCGATVYTSNRMTLLSELGDLKGMKEAAPPTAVADLKAPTRQAWRWAALGLVGVLALAAGWSSHRYYSQSNVSAQALQVAVQDVVDQGGGPGTDPVCIANGLAYDDTRVHVEVSNSATLAWMDALVVAGLYELVPDASAVAKDGSAVRVYAPLTALGEWGGSRRLCMARSVRLQAVRNLGPVQPMRFRGQPFTGVSADVVWSMAEPAPWLVAPRASAALVAQWPAWRGSRWTVGPNGWTLVQRRHFFFYEGRWMTAESLERLNDLPPRTQPPL